MRPTDVFIWSGPGDVSLVLRDGFGQDQREEEEAADAVDNR